MFASVAAVQQPDLDFFSCFCLGEITSTVGATPQTGTTPTATTTTSTSAATTITEM